MKLIVGLGNPGEEYVNTRHNAGFSAINLFLSKQFSNYVFKNKFNGNYYECTINSEKVIFLEPQSYINLSGEVIKKFVDYYKIDIENILIIHDDMDIELGNVKLKEQGSSGGHNGLKNIELHLSTQKYNRIKIGISKHKDIEMKDYVLGKLSGVELETFNKSLEIVSSILNDYFNMTFTNLMNKYNVKQR